MVVHLLVAGEDGFPGSTAGVGAMSQGRWGWITEVWRAIVGDRSLLLLLAAALILCVAILALTLR